MLGCVFQQERIKNGVLIDPQLMKTIIAGLLVSATSLFGQNIRSISEGPVYDRQGHMVSYRYVDGTRDLYAYDSGWRMTSFTNRSGKVTHFQPSGAVAKSSNGQTVAPAATPIDSTLRSEEHTS